jgi:DUF1009 family protein
MEALLQHPEAGVAVLVQADNFAVDDARPRQAGLQHGNHLGELDILHHVISAEEGQLMTIKTAEDTQTVVLRLKDPVRVVERCGHECTEHRVKLGWHGCGRELPCQL